MAELLFFDVALNKELKIELTCWNGVGSQGNLLVEVDEWPPAFAFLHLFAYIPKGQERGRLGIVSSLMIAL